MGIGKVSTGWESNREQTVSGKHSRVLLRVGLENNLGNTWGVECLDPSLVPRSNVGLYP